MSLSTHQGGSTVRDCCPVVDVTMGHFVHVTMTVTMTVMMTAMMTVTTMATRTGLTTFRIGVRALLGYIVKFYHYIPTSCHSVVVSTLAL